MKLNNSYFKDPRTGETKKVKFKKIINSDNHPKDINLQLAAGDTESYTKKGEFFLKYGHTPAYYLNITTANGKVFESFGDPEASFIDVFERFIDETFTKDFHYTKYWIYFHNLYNWDGLFLEHWINTQFEGYIEQKHRLKDKNDHLKCYKIFRVSKNQILEIQLWGTSRHGKKFHIFIRDSARMLPGQLNSWAKSIGKEKYLIDEETNKPYEPDFHKVPHLKTFAELEKYDNGKLVKYARNDTQVLVEIIKYYAPIFAKFFPKYQPKVRKQAKFNAKRDWSIKTGEITGYYDGIFFEPMTAAGLSKKYMHHNVLREITNGNLPVKKGESYLSIKTSVWKWLTWRDIHKNNEPNRLHYFKGGYTNHHHEKLSKRNITVLRHPYFTEEEIAEAQTIRGVITSHDINSMYPYIMTRPLPYGDMLKTPPKDGSTYITYYRIHIIKATLNKGFPAIMRGSKVAAGGNDTYAKEIKDSYDIINSETLEIFKTFYTMDYKILETQYFKTFPFLANLITDLYELRKDAKKNNIPLSEVIKLILNSMYGKLVENPEHENILIDDVPFNLARGTYLDKNYNPTEDLMLVKYIVSQEKVDLDSHHTSKGICYGIKVTEVLNAATIDNFIAGAYITECARNILWSIIIYNKESFLYADTDSLFLSAPLILKSSLSWYNVEIDSSKLGAFKIEAEGDTFIFIQNKKYLLLNNGEPVKKGLSGMDRKTDLEDFVRTGTGIQVKKGYSRSGPYIDEVIYNAS